MADEKAVREDTQEKTHGDPLDAVLNSGTGLTQDTTGKDSEPEPQKEPLK